MVGLTCKKDKKMPPGLYKYQKIANQLLTQIADGDYREDDYFSSEHNLTSQFKVNRRTIRQALKLLVDAEVVYKHSTYGIFIKNPHYADLFLKQSVTNNGNPLITPPKPAFKERICQFTGILNLQHAQFSDATYLDAVSRAMKKFSDNFSVEFMFLNTHDPKDLIADKKCFSQIAENGLIWISPKKKDLPIISELTKSGIKIICLSSGPWPEDVNYVFSDERNAAFLATNHLIEFGHSRIAFLRKTDVSTSIMRAQGIADAYREHNISFDEFLLSDHDRNKDIISQLRYILEKKQPTAFLADNYHQGKFFMSLMHERNMQTPEDISIISFDDSPVLELQQVPVSAVSQPVETIVYTATQKLIDLKHNRIKSPIHDESLKSKLIIRKSVGPVSENNKRLSTA